MTEIQFPLRTVRIFENGPPPSECERGQIVIGQAYLRSVSDEVRIIEMRKLYEQGIPITRIAARMKCSRFTVYKKLKLPPWKARA